MGGGFIEGGVLLFDAVYSKLVFFKAVCYCTIPFQALIYVFSWILQAIVFLIVL